MHGGNLKLMQVFIFLKQTCIGLCDSKNIFWLFSNRNVHCQMVRIGSVVFKFQLRKFEAVNNLLCSFTAIVLQEYEETSQFIIIFFKYDKFLLLCDEQWLVRRRKGICMLHKVDERSSWSWSWWCLGRMFDGSISGTLRIRTRYCSCRLVISGCLMKTVMPLDPSPRFVRA